MSRCFPYPPPGCAPTSARKEALIESIKFQKEKVKADELRKKDKKREKKDKREHKKNKIIQNQEKPDNARDCGEKIWADAKADFLHKSTSFESELLERSSLTEEHAKPVCLSAPSTSSDSTENSNKRKRPVSPVDISRGHGKIIRIRLSAKKQNQCDASVDEQAHCSTSGRTQFPSQASNDNINLRQRSEGKCSTSGLRTVNSSKSLVLKTGGERIRLSSKQIETSPVFEEKIPLPAADAVLTPKQKEGLLYRNLIENWTPPKSQDWFVGTADEDWLFGVDNKFGRTDKKSICRDESMSDCNTSLPWPRAQYLPEVDIYALPYTIPF